jgi:hypothetical protein
MNHLIKRTKQVPRRKVEEKQLERIRDQFAAWSKKINKIRNEHVHEFTFEGKDYGAAEMAMLLISKGKMKELKPIKNLAIFNISDEWKKIFKKNILALINNYDKALGRVKRILLRLE